MTVPLTLAGSYSTGDCRGKDLRCGKTLPEVSGTPLIFLQNLVDLQRSSPLQFASTRDYVDKMSFLKVNGTMTFLKDQPPTHRSLKVHPYKASRSRRSHCPLTISSVWDVWGFDVTIRWADWPCLKFSLALTWTSKPGGHDRQIPCTGHSCAWYPMGCSMGYR